MFRQSPGARGDATIVYDLQKVDENNINTRILVMDDRLEDPAKRAEDDGSITYVGSQEGQIVSYKQTDLFPDLTWDTCPEMTHSGASEDLQRVWVAVVMASRETLGAIVQCQCLQLNSIARPLVQRVLSSRVELSAGFACFVTGPGSSDCCEFGRTWCPDKWRQRTLISTPDAPASGDFHAWLEDKTHVIDMSTFQIAPLMRESNETFPIKGSEGTFPPMLYWAKRDLPSHPNQAWGDRKLLLWRRSGAVQLVASKFAAMAPKLTAVRERAFEIYEALKGGEKVAAAPSELWRFVMN
jgi:hypothetical protein